jgi:hypothetical protein
MRGSGFRFTALALVCLMARSAWGQEGSLILPPSQTPEQFIATMKQDVRVSKRQMVSQAMVPELRPDQVKSFWAVYDRYEKEMSGLFDQSMLLVQRYGAVYNNATSADVQQLADDLFTLEAAKLLVRKRYFAEFTKVLPAKAAARFTQVDFRVDRAIDAKIASEIPVFSVK